MSAELALHEHRPAIALDPAVMRTRSAQPPFRSRLPAVFGIVHHLSMFTSEATTRGIRVAVVSEYSPGNSQPDQQRWFFLYTITITNEGREAVQLLTRHWIITDATGHVEEVQGQGVIGKQPVIKPGESFTYTSGAPLRASSGTMEGTYQMRAGDGVEFDVRIAPFMLSEPYTVH